MAPNIYIYLHESTQHMTCTPCNTLGLPMTNQQKNYYLCSSSLVPLCLDCIGSPCTVCDCSIGGSLYARANVSATSSGNINVASPYTCTHTHTHTHTHKILHTLHVYTYIRCDRHSNILERYRAD